MRRPALFAVAFLLSLFALAAVAAAGTTALPGSGYVWAQPGAAPVSNLCDQPPAWIPAATTVTAVAPGSSYRWAQPGAARVSNPCDQPPAWLPIA